MRNITLTRDDSIETVLPLVEEAMETGDICRINHIDSLGPLGIAALALLTMADCLMDSRTGRLFRPHPGFLLIGVDDSGHARIIH